LGIILVFSAFAFTSCQDKICPAYQSYFVLDQRERDKMFSLFDTDSLPKAYDGVNKSNYGVIDQPRLLPYLRKLDELKMVDREVIHPTPLEEDSLGGAGFDAIGEMTSDSLVMDTEPMELEGDKEEEPQKKYKIEEKKNEEQRTYDRLYGEYLKAQEQPKKKKEKEETPAEPEPAAIEDQPGPDQDEEVAPEPKKKKKGLGGFFKKKKGEGSGSAGEAEEE